MYGVDSFVHPDYRSNGIGGKLMDARFAVAKRRNLRGMLAGSLPFDYHKVAKQMTIEQYVREVAAGKRFDGNLSKQLRKGFKVGPIIPEYADSWRSHNWGVTIFWDNPEYRKRVWPLLVRPSLQSPSAVHP